MEKLLAFAESMRNFAEVLNEQKETLIEPDCKNRDYKAGQCSVAKYINNKLKELDKEVKSKKNINLSDCENFGIGC